MNSTLWAPEFLNTTWPEQQQQQAKVFLYLKDGYLKKITLIDFQNDPLDFFLFSDSNNMYVDMQCRSCLFRGCGLPSFTDWFSGCCWEEEEEEEGRDKETPEMEKHILLCVLPKTSVLFFSFCVCRGGTFENFSTSVKMRRPRRELERNCIESDVRN